MTARMIRAVLLLPLFGGCAALYGYNIHAQGTLSESFFRDIPQIQSRVGLYLPENLTEFISKDKGNWYSDPQTYYVGEGLTPMLIEAFQYTVSEPVLFEEEPTAEMMREYGVAYLLIVDILAFDNIKPFPGQTLEIMTETGIYDSDLNLIQSYRAFGSSQASKVFNKKGGPEINLNAALENNVKATMLYLVDTVSA